MAATEAQDAWVQTVLGIAFSDEAGASESAGTRHIWRNVQEIWNTASERADTQVAALQEALRNSADEDYRAIAELGLNGVTGGHKVRLMAALRDVDAATPDSTRIAAARKIVDAFIGHLASDPRIDAMDTNELGLPVNLAGTLIPALEELDGALVALARSA